MGQYNLQANVEDAASAGPGPGNGSTRNPTARRTGSDDRTRPLSDADRRRLGGRRRRGHLREHEPGDRGALGDHPRSHGGGRGPGRRGGAPCVHRRPVVAHHADRARAQPAPAGGPPGRSLGAARPHRDRRHRQDAQGNALAGEVHRGLLPLLRGVRRQGARRHPAHRQARSLRLHRARTAGGGGGGGAVELPALPRRGQARTGARRRQHGGAQGVGACVGGDAGVRPPDRGGGHPTRRGQHRDRPRRPLRPGTDLPSAGWPA